VNPLWLQIGYKKVKDAPESLKYVDCVDEKRIESALYDGELRFGTRVGMK
jgi:hypothetical protein